MASPAGELLVDRLAGWGVDTATRGPYPYTEHPLNGVAQFCARGCETLGHRQLHCGCRRKDRES